MNERIRELWAQCVIKHTKTPMNWQPVADDFAELIVRECVRYFNEDYQRDFNTLWREDLTIGILEHFGVES